MRTTLRALSLAVVAAGAVALAPRPAAATYKPQPDLGVKLLACCTSSSAQCCFTSGCQITPSGGCVRVSR